MRVLMVCLGNICRSPLAEGILQHKAALHGLDWYVDSAGAGGWHAGEQPDKRSIRVAQKHGIDISHQRARQIRPDDLDRFDLVLAMDRSNLAHVLALADNPQQRAHQIRLVTSWAYPDQPVETPDPYYGNETDFESVFQLLDQACEALIAAMHPANPSNPNTP